MIDKLRKRIFWIIQISLSIIVLGVIVLFTSFSYKNTITSSTMFMDRLEGKENGPRDFEMPREDPFLNIDGIYRLEINNNKVVNSPNDVSDEIKDIALKASEKNKEEGYIENYIYKVRKFGNNGEEITLIENEDAIKRLKTTQIFAITIGIIGLGTIYLISKKISKTIVKPVENSFVKQKQFVSDASHELKTPLAVIEANADVLANKVGENKWITYIQNEVQSMNKLVNNLLVLAKMENIKNTNNNKFNLSKEAQMSVAVFESMIYEKKINLETNIKENIEFTGDKEDIKHIISILLDNAIKHTEENKKIQVNLEKEKNSIKLEVKNEGEPIPKGEEEKIFERFYRVDKARNRNEKRYGLRAFYSKRNC